MVLIMKRFIKYVGGPAAWCAVVVFMLGGSNAGIIMAACLGAAIGITGLVFRAFVLGWEVVGDELDRKVNRWWYKR
jgi:hypothetical protein|tara:strand:+ start:91 stop:318 length:228 start_codon:yes stop_codon:yes gene_type:complete